MIFVNYPLETFSSTASGALATVIWECCRVAANRGVEPLVITRSGGGQPFDWPHTVTVPYPPVPNGPVGMFLCRVGRRVGGWQHLRQGNYARRVAAALGKPDLIGRPLLVLNDPEGAVFLRRRFPHAFIAHWFQNQQTAKPAARVRFGASVDAVAAVSRFTADWVERYYGMPGQVRVIPNAVDAEVFRPTSSPPSGSLVLNFVGRTGIEKGPDLLLRAALSLAHAGHKFRVQILGSNHWDRFEADDYQRELSTLAAELERLGVEVRRPGHVSRAGLPAELARAHIHVVPARWDEPFGMTTIEGMACGLATVASATGGTPEVAGDAALFFQRESVEGLASHLSALIQDPALRADYSARARRRAEQFTWDRTWTSLCEMVAH